MKLLIKRILERGGIYYAKRQYMPCGIDWLWDICRITRGGSIKTIFDVGANVGQTTAAIKARFAEAEVHAFEPVSQTFNTLERNVRHLEKVICHRLALSSQIGRATITAIKDSPLNRLIQEEDDTSSIFSQLESVDTETIDHFCESQHIERIDILKIDAEGTDLKVLQGAFTMLMNGKVAFVFVEVGFEENDHAHVHLPSLYLFLTGVGLRPYSFYDYCRLKPPSYEEEGLGLVFANILFVSNIGINSIKLT